jgi:hypothetical protein
MGKAIPPYFGAEQFKAVLSALCGDGVEKEKDAMEGWAFGFMFLASFQALQRGDHLRKMLWSMSSVYPYQPHELVDIAKDMSMEASIFNMAHTKTADGHSVAPVPLVRHRDPWRCALGFLAMYLFMYAFMVGSHKELGEDGQYHTVRGHGLPDITLGWQAWSMDHVSDLLSS